MSANIAGMFAPPCQDIGVYSVEMAPRAKLKVNHRFKNIAVLVGVDPGGDYFADANFSEMRAIIRDRNSDWRKPCSVLFPQEVA